MLIFMGTRVSYPQEVKLKAVEMKLQVIPTKVILAELNIRNDTQIETGHVGIRMVKLLLIRFLILKM